VKGLGKDRWTAEEHSDVGVRMFVSDAGEDDIPVGSAEMGGCTKISDGVFLCSDIGYDDIVHVILLDLGGEVDIDLDTTARVLFLDGVQERVEPLGCTEVTDDPGEVDFGESGGFGVSEVVHAVPDRLEDGGERCYSDAGADEENGFVVEEVLGCGTEGAVDHDTRKDLVEGRIGLGAYNLGSVAARFLVFFPEVASESFGEGFGEVADDADVDRDVVLFGCGGESERVPLEVADIGTVDEDVLSGTGGGLVLLDLDFDDLGRVLDDLADESTVPGADFAEDTLVDEDETTNEPVTPEDADLEPRAEGRTIGFDHAPHAVELPADEEGDEEVVGVPESFEFGATTFLHGEVDHGEETGVHDPSCGSWAGGKVCSEEGEDFGSYSDC